ncbi:polysaccharide biosynthesis/export family protein [Albibacterium indicum]|uniref:polysaccharide biosynthesis/export family protein n=1 Tax=Albibacterium indicum TaxID=2292082 RepID=UPI001980A30B|nr:polysaccharide biosynthesis/export family protein [Pedobacter indicus]
MNKFTLGMLILVLLFTSSCITSQKVVYVEDMKSDTLYRVANLPPLRIQKNDRIKIEISAKNPELAIPFNAGVGSYSMNEAGHISSTSQTAMDGYLVDEYGNISFPILGTLHVENKTVEELKQMLQKRLKDERYIDEPIVKAELINLKIVMMGEVGSVGVLTVPDSRITLLEALARSGGLTNNATADRVAVIREENGERIKIYTDIQSNDLFDSPAFYLKQNDIVYVEPKAAERSIREERTWRYFTTVLGSVTLIFSVINLFK